jgi:hypothetical protein
MLEETMLVLFHPVHPQVDFNYTPWLWGGSGNVQTAFLQRFQCTNL